MGVHGLWRLIEPSGKPVPLETLENKILAVDISIWLHQAIKGFQDSKGAPLPNAHLLGIYHRVCKLLYFRIKPVFIFDGGVPVLKKQTIAKRNQQKHKNINEATDIQSKLLKTLLKHSAISKVIADKAITTNDLPDKEKTKENMFILPAVPSTVTDDSTLDSGSSSDESSATSPVKQWDLHTIDEKSSHFRSLPADVRHEILTDLIETRKQSSWGRIHEIPTESNDFSSFQMKRLLKRFSVQTSLEECVKEMGGHSLSLGDLEKLLNAEGIITDTQKTGGKRIAYDDETRFLLIKDVQKAMEDAKNKLQAIEENPESTSSSNENQSNEIITTTTDVELERDLEAAIHLSLQTNDENTKEEIQESAVIEENRSVDDEYEKDLQAAIQLSLQDQPSTSKDLNKENLSLMDSFNEEEMDSDSDNDNVTTITKLQQAKSYMLEYSGLTPNEIDKIINSNKQKPKVINKSKKLLINKKPEKIPEVSSTTIDEEKPKSPETKASIEIKLDNESNSLPEISKEENTVEIMSDSDDSDFVEVSTSNSNKLDINKESLQIVINPKEKVDDDIFSDIFNENKPVITKLDQEVIKPTLEVLDTTKEKEEIEKIEIIKESELKTIEDKIETIEDDKETIEYNKKEVEDNKEEIEDNEEIVKNKQIQKIIPEKPLLTIEELNKMKSDLVSEQEELILERNARTRIAGNITDQMYQEAQELLELFGVPYVIAPMEAEAQCAFLNEINLTDGTITDDSDIWLFGGKTVYKNFFNQNKHVLEFRAESIEHHFKLTRQQLILLAMLVGSDYTVGIQGIGPVTALEILAAFPPSRQTNISVLTQAELISGLKEFRKWLCDSKTIGVGRTTLRSKLKNVNINEGFPNMQVVQAYLQPEVETCADRFTWSKPDIVGLIDFAKEKFGWTKLKSEEILKPVIKKMEDKNIQKTIRNYFATKHKINVDLTEDKLSKRVKKAINKIANKDQDEDVDEDKPKKTKSGKPNKRTKQEGETSKPKTTKKSKTEVSKPDDEPEKEDLEPKPSTTRKTKIDYQNLGTINKENPHPASIEAKRRVRARKKEQLHIKESIPQKEQDKRAALKSKLKAIEVFRKSKEGPGFVKKRPKVITPVKEDAGLSESSSDD